MPIYLLHTLYHYVVIGLMHHMEDELVMHTASIAILATQMSTIIFESIMFM